MATTSQRLSIRIPPSSYEEEIGAEYNAFGELCQYIKPTEACGTCSEDNHEDACGMCKALAVKNVTKSRTIYNERQTWFNWWFKILLGRKRDAMG